MLYCSESEESHGYFLWFKIPIFQNWIFYVLVLGPPGSLFPSSLARSFDFLCHSITDAAQTSTLPLYVMSWNYKIIKFWNFEFWNFEILRFWNFKILKFLKFWIFKMWYIKAVYLFVLHQLSCGTTLSEGQALCCQHPPPANCWRTWCGIWWRPWSPTPWR